MYFGANGSTIPEYVKYGLPSGKFNINFERCGIRGVGSRGQGGDCPPTFQSGRANICICSPTFWHCERLKTFCTNFMRYIVLLKLKTRACHSIFGSVFGLKKSRRLLGYQMSIFCPPTPTPPHPHFWRTSYARGHNVLISPKRWKSVSVGCWYSSYSG